MSSRKDRRRVAQREIFDEITFAFVDQPVDELVGSRDDLVVPSGYPP
jgi:hypothetical protein